MQFYILALATLTSVVSAVNIRGFILPACIGPSFVCTNIPSGACCNFPVDFFSMTWTLPAGARGTGYTFDHCFLAYPSVSGKVTNQCFTYLGLIEPSSAKWDIGRAKRQTLQEPEKCERCVEPDTFVYTTAEGKTRVIDVPVGQAGIVAEIAGRKEWKLLDGFADSKGEMDLAVEGEVKTLEGPKPTVTGVKVRPTLAA